MYLAVCPTSLSLNSWLQSFVTFANAFPRTCLATTTDSSVIWFNDVDIFRSYCILYAMCIYAKKKICYVHREHNTHNIELCLDCLVLFTYMCDPHSSRTHIIVYEMFRMANEIVHWKLNLSVSFCISERWQH